MPLEIQITVSGPKGVGKSTVANIIASILARSGFKITREGINNPQMPRQSVGELTPEQKKILVREVENGG